jgi:transglutaminase-like putative cysteine protease
MTAFSILESSGVKERALALNAKVITLTRLHSRSTATAPVFGRQKTTEVHNRGYGVCRDLAQLAIALCRSISIPARLVAGYLYQLEPMDLHAWFEVYVGGRWYAFDPSQSDLRGGRVIIAFGRDAADVSIFHQFGLGCVLNGMNVQVNLLDKPQ